MKMALIVLLVFHQNHMKMKMINPNRIFIIMYDESNIRWISAKYLKNGKYYENYFDYKGRLRFSPLFLEEDTILNVLGDELISTKINQKK